MRGGSRPGTRMTGSGGGGLGGGRGKAVAWVGGWGVEEDVILSATRRVQSRHVRALTRAEPLRAARCGVERNGRTPRAASTSRSPLRRLLCLAGDGRPAPRGLVPGRRHLLRDTSSVQVRELDGLLAWPPGIEPHAESPSPSSLALPSLSLSLAFWVITVPRVRLYVFLLRNAMPLMRSVVDDEVMMPSAALLCACSLMLISPSPLSKLHPLEPHRGGTDAHWRLAGCGAHAERFLSRVEGLELHS